MPRNFPPSLKKIDILKVLPKRPISKIVGKLTEWPAPDWVLDFCIKTFQKAYGVNPDDFYQGAKYKSFQEYFVREIKEGRRSFSQKKKDLCSPVDGTHTENALIEKDGMIKAKDFRFSLAQLLSDIDLAKDYIGGKLQCLYLAPYNYHRVHMPTDAKVRQGKYIAGEKWPVFPEALKLLNNLFAVNERAWVEFESKEHGPFIMVLVGAMCVGKIGIRDVGDLDFENGTVLPLEITGKNWKKGDEMGRFYFGSTVLLITPPNAVDFIDLQGAKPIKMGEVLGQFKP